MESIKEKIIKIVNANLKESNEKSVDIVIEQENYDLSQLGMDSISFIRVVVALEEAFEMEIPDEYLLITEMNTISKMADVISAVLDHQNSVIGE